MAKIYQIKISLKGITPPIWRRIEVSSDIDLEQFANNLIDAMGWHGSHLMCFEIGGEEYFRDEESVHDLGGKLMHKTKLNKCLSTPKQKIRFAYDFGDDWQHDVVLEKILEVSPGVQYPRCTGGKRHCPPEDCGGVWGYQEILEALKDPENPEHKELLEWVGEGFDAEGFEVGVGSERMS